MKNLPKETLKKAEVVVELETGDIVAVDKVKTNMHGGELPKPHIVLIL